MGILNSNEVAEIEALNELKFRTKQQAFFRIISSERKLRAQLAQLTEYPTENFKAYEALLEGHIALRRSTRGSFAEAIGLYQRAIDLDPGSRYLVNPGSVGQPRDRYPRAAFGVFDTEKMTFDFCRVEYDIDACAKKILQAGLPPELARRLSKGK